MRAIRTAFESSPIKRLGLRVLALRAVVVGQIAGRPHRVSIIGTQHAALDLQRLTVEGLGLRGVIILAESQVGVWGEMEIVRAPGRPN